MASMATDTDPSSIIQLFPRFMASLLTILKLMNPHKLFWEIEGEDKSLPPFLRYIRGKMGELRTAANAFLPVFFELVIEAERETSSSQMAYVKELDRICSLTCTNWCDLFYKYSFSHLRRLSDRDQDRSSWNIDLFCLCICKGLQKSLHEECEHLKYQVQGRQGRPLLHFVFDYYHPHFQSLPATAPNGYDILMLLLSHGGQPNEIFQGKTCWQHALEEVFSSKITSDLPMLVRMLEHGADPNQQFSRLSSGSEHALVCATSMVKPTEWETELHKDKLECKLELIGSLITNGADLKPDGIDILNGTCKTNRHLKEFVKRKIAEREENQSQEVPPRKSKRRLSGQTSKLSIQRKKRG